MEAEKNRAAILEVDRATGRWRIFASGLRNPNGRPSNRKATPLDRRQRARRARPRPRAGLPDLREGRRVLRLAVQLLRPERRSAGSAAATRPRRQGDRAGLRPELPRRAAGPCVLHRDTLPAAYRGGAFVGEHGSWNRPKFNGYKVVFVPFKDGNPNGVAQDVVTGFLNLDGNQRGRPVGVAVDKAGALIIADDVGNTVWRVSAAGKS